MLEVLITLKYYAPGEDKPVIHKTSDPENAMDFLRQATGRSFSGFIGLVVKRMISSPGECPIKGDEGMVVKVHTIELCKN